MRACERSGPGVDLGPIDACSVVGVWAGVLGEVVVVEGEGGGISLL